LITQVTKTKQLQPDTDKMTKILSCLAIAVLSSAANVIAVRSGGLRVQQRQQPEQDRDLQSDSTCGITGFSVYNSRSKTTTPLDTVQYVSDFPEAKIMLDTYPQGKINIFANTDTTGCPKNTGIGCVLMKWGNFAKSTERWAPYTLYKNEPKTDMISTWKIPDNVKGFQSLEAWAYNSSSCSGRELNYVRVDVQAVPKTTQVIKLPPIVATYNGVTKLPRTRDRIALESETCKFLEESFGFGFTYKGSLFVTGFRCWSSSSNTATLPPSTTYRIEIKFTIDGEVSMYLNPDMPTQAEVLSYAGGLFRDEIGVGPGSEDFVMSKSVKAVLNLTNPYLNYTKITIK
jgi:hypothetical protein